MGEGGSVAVWLRGNGSSVAPWQLGSGAVELVAGSTCLLLSWWDGKHMVRSEAGLS